MVRAACVPLAGLVLGAACHAAEREASRGEAVAAADSAPVSQSPPSDSLTRVLAADSTRIQEPCTGSGWLACAREQEGAALRGSGGRARREDGVLYLKLSEGRELSFRDVASDDFDHVQHRYLGPVPGLPIDVVALDYWEGGEYLAVHQSSGDTTFLDALPLVSPRRDWILTASTDLEAGYAPNRLTIYRVARDGLELEWRASLGTYGHPESWGAVDPRWEDSASVSFERLRYDPNGPATVRGSGRLERKDGEWRIVLAPDG